MSLLESARLETNSRLLTDDCKGIVEIDFSLPNHHPKGDANIWRLPLFRLQILSLYHIFLDAYHTEYVIYLLLINKYEGDF